jgi:hypothetical protein
VFSISILLATFTFDLKKRNFPIFLVTCCQTFINRQYYCPEPPSYPGLALRRHEAMVPSKTSLPNGNTHKEDLTRSPEGFSSSRSSSPPATHDTSRIGWHMPDLQALAKNIDAVRYSCLLQTSTDLHIAGRQLFLSQSWDFSISVCERRHDAVGGR